MILEAATGVLSKAKPFSSDWNGSVGRDGLLMREFAFKATYIYNSHLSISSTIGQLNYWYENRISFFPEPDWGWGGSKNRKVLYMRPIMQFSADFGRLDLGALIYNEDPEHQLDYFSDNSSNRDRRFWPVIGIELGEQDIFVYGRWLDSFPLLTGGGEFEMGFLIRPKKLYEHRVFVGFSGFQEIALGYRGEFPVYKQFAITPGFSIGEERRDKVYMLTFGIKTIIDHNQKKRF